MSNFKKFTFVTVAIMMVLWSIGGALVPIEAEAASAGDLIKLADSSAVYYYDGTKRYVFPNEKTYKSWYADFSGVVTVSQTEMEGIDFGGNITIRPGTWLVKVTTIPKVYAVEPGGILRWVDSEARAIALYGANWNTMIVDVPDPFWVNYSTGADITTDQHTVGTLVKYAGDDTTYYTDAGGVKRPVASDAAMAANMFRSEFVRNTAITYSDGSSITGKESDLVNVSSSSAPVAVTGDIAVALDAATPASATVPQSATSVPFLKFTVTNGNSTAVTITNLTLHRSGPGATADFDNLYIYQGSTRLTSGRTVNSSSNNAVYSSMSVSVPAGGSVTLDVLADMNSSAGSGNVHTFEVTSLTASSATASGTAKGNPMTVAGIDSGSMTIAKNGTITNPKVAEKNVEIAQFQVTAGSVEDVELKRIALFNSGNISRSNLSNFVMKDRATGTAVATADAINSKDLVVFEFATPVAFDKGNAKTYSVYADVGASAKSGDTIAMYLENSADLFAVGKTYGYGTSVTRTTYDGDSCTSSAGDCSYSAVDAGQLTITLNGPSASDVAKNGKDVEILNFTMAAQVEVEVRQFSLILNNGGSSTANFNDGTTSNYTDLKITDTSTGTVVWGPSDLSGTGSATSQDILFTEDTTLAAGSATTYSVTVDIANLADVVDGDVIAATIDVSDFSNQVKNLSNNSFLATTDIVPGSDVSGNQMTVRVPSLTITLATTPTSQTYIKGTIKKDFIGFNFTAGIATNVIVNSIMTTCYIDDSNVETDFVKGQDTDASGGTTSCQDDVPTVRLKVDGDYKGDAKSPGATTSGTSTFSSLGLEIAAGTTKVVIVEGDISQSAYRNSNVERIAFDLVDVSADIAVADPQGNSITATGDAVNGGTSPNRIVTISNAGTLTVGAAPTEIDVNDSRIVTAGSQGVTVSKFKFTAQNEELKVTKMRIKLVSADADADVSDAITAIYLYDGATKVAGPVSPTPVTAAGTTDAQADFNTISPAFIVPKDGSRTLTVKVDMNTISGGADSGDEFSIDLEADDNAEARGTSGSTVLTDLGTDTAGNDVVMRKSQPKIELVTNPHGTTLSNGTITLLKFKVTAMDDDVSLKHFTFETANSDGTNVTVASQSIKQTGQSNLTVTSSIAGTTTITTNITFNSAEAISRGASKTYEFQGSVTGAASADQLSTKLLGDTATVTGELDDLIAAQRIDDLDAVLNVGDDSAAADAYNVIWSDESAIPHNDTADGDADGTDNATASNDWTNGRYVKTVATDSQALTFPS
ncbi:MAG: hypothetical protein ABIJ81_03985 [Patescibacteria group bacterium]